MAIMDCDTVGRLHPAIRRKNPRSRNKRADRYHTSSEKVELWTDAMKAEKHDSQKPCLRKKAVNTSSAISGPMAGPAICAKRANPRPNSQESTIPVTTPIPKPMAKMLSQNL